VKITDAYASKDHVYSFEFFPPKTDKGAENLLATCAELRKSVQPDFVSVTYGAGGSTRDRTHQIVTTIQSTLDIPAMAHQTCIAATKDDIRANVQRLQDAGIENVLALRGDMPKEGAATAGLEFEHATELIGFLKSEFNISVGAATYPESHPESKTADQDLHWTRVKQDQGAEFLITQLFFDNADYFDHVRKARAAGVTIPIVPGIMPITNVAQVERFTQMCGATVPEELRARLRPVQDDPGAVMAIGIEHAIDQCRGLLGGGAPGLHFYTLNKSFATRGILAAIR
jgi:methylenetetrahydrofolate reductase (NADPH)